MNISLTNVPYMMQSIVLLSSGELKAELDGQFDFMQRSGCNSSKMNPSFFIMIIDKRTAVDATIFMDLLMSDTSLPKYRKSISTLVGFAFCEHNSSYSRRKLDSSSKSITLTKTVGHEDDSGIEPAIGIFQYCVLL